GHPGMIAEPKAGLVIVGRGGIIIEHPGRAALAARPVDEMAEFRPLAGPEAPHATGLPVLAPGFHIAMVRSIVRGDDLVAVAGGSLRELPRARQMQRDALEAIEHCHDRLPQPRDATAACHRTATPPRNMIALAPQGTQAQPMPQRTGKQPSANARCAARSLERL